MVEQGKNYACNNKVRSRIHCCCGKAIICKYYDCVCVCMSVLLRVLCAILSCVASPAVLYLSTLSPKRHDFYLKHFSF
jgi:hypothetical protein